jgi:hypothetical protein
MTIVEVRRAPVDVPQHASLAKREGDTPSKIYVFDASIQLLICGLKIRFLAPGDDVRRTLRWVILETFDLAGMLPPAPNNAC